jgi:hypothetical protein
LGNNSMRQVRRQFVVVTTKISMSSVAKQVVDYPK